ncbi:uncharacterized protein LOC116204161 [Punica granatum]|uniref:Uncharacterized protein LOC116204161 n=2 Tax=Punica granatum TaxID=22663 RepID=A0A6P8D4S4_PUNGR|nr:uncharacterized protein LOC116204161 [Punica granatum]PKI75767.1 hypothetical protein CRG98_003810 [Punica granatum]
MTNPSEQFLFLSSSAPGIYSPIPSPSSPDPAFRSRENSCKRRSKLISIGLPLSLDPSNPDGIPRPKKVGRKPDPHAPKITRPCSECGKKFWSWKALFGHMRCHPERQWRGMNPPVNFQSQPPEGTDSFSGTGLGAVPATTEEDHEVAACLLMLANGRPGEVSDHNAYSNREVDSSGVPSETGSGPGMDDPGGHHHQHHHLLGRFECSSCKKVFGSHQALGGHRASHKNVKGCFANAMMRSSSVDYSENATASDNNRKSEFRECEDSGASLPTQLVMNSFAAKETCDVDLSLSTSLLEFALAISAIPVLDLSTPHPGDRLKIPKPSHNWLTSSGDENWQSWDQTFLLMCTGVLERQKNRASGATTEQS